MTESESRSSPYVLEPEQDVLLVHLRGPWALASGLPPAGPVLAALEGAPATRRLAFRTDGLGAWDSTLVTFVHALAADAGARGLQVDTSALPEGARRLLDLARAVPPRPLAPASEDDSLLARVGRPALAAWDTAGDALTFLGETVLALAGPRSAAGPASAASTSCTPSRRPASLPSASWPSSTS